MFFYTLPGIAANVGKKGTLFEVFQKGDTRSNCPEHATNHRKNSGAL